MPHQEEGDGANSRDRLDKREARNLDSLLGAGSGRVLGSEAGAIDKVEGERSHSQNLQAGGAFEIWKLLDVRGTIQRSGNRDNEL